MNFLTKMTRRCFSINNPDKLKHLLNTDMDYTKMDYCCFHYVQAAVVRKRKSQKHKARLCTNKYI